MDKAGQEKEKRAGAEVVIPVFNVAEPNCQYGAEAFEMYANNNVGTVTDYRKRESNNLATTKSR